MTDLFSNTDHRLRVAVYIYTNDAPENMTGTTLQMNHFSFIIAEHPNWDVEGVYYDIRDGKPAYEHRPQFDMMLEKCREGKIDLIITNRISRFCKTLSDTLHTVSELSSLPALVSVYFETESIITPFSKDQLKTLAMMQALETAHDFSYFNTHGRRYSHE